jgi:phosphoenolpyruvate-protein kinase (PTS system EI component)
MGLRELSMQPGVLLAAKETVRESRVGELKAQVGRLMECTDETEMGELLEALGATG